MKPTSTSPWITRMEPQSQAVLRLFCFPYAGGSASVFGAWSASLPAEIEVCAVQYPGRENRLLETPFLEMGPLVRTLCTAILPFLDKPYAFFGHSMGALVSFELACRLRTLRFPPPVHLFVSGSRAAHIPEHKITYNLPEPKLVEVLREMNGTPLEVLESPEFRRLFLPLIRADLGVDETYAYTARSPLECPMTAFGGLEDNEVERKDLEAWCRHTSGSFFSRMFPGDHFFLRSAKGAVLQSISQNLKQHLAALVEQVGPELLATFPRSSEKIPTI